MLKKVLALVLVLTLSLSLSAVAFAADAPVVGEINNQGGTITGETEVVALAVRVVVPTKIVIGIDPFERKSEAGNQIFNPIDFPVINKSDVDVKVGFALTAATGSGATATTYVQDVDDVVSDDQTVTTKTAYFAAMVATGGSTVPTYNSASPGVTGAGFDPTNADSLVVFDADGKADFAIKVKKAALVYATDGVTINDAASTVASDGYSAFRFYAKLNSYATWAAGDLMVGGNYTITALSNDNYTNTETVTDTMGLVKPTARVGFVDQQVNFTVKSTANKTIGFNYGGATAITKLEWFDSADGSGTGSTMDVSKTLTLDIPNDELTIKRTTGSGMVAGTNESAYTGSLKVTLDTGKTSIIKVVIS